ncbi:DUF1127 domain-containing protein [Aminobacter aminovorans]|uniref:DUF1127 domain-containing protein n=1 Tax=Aminobacter aminovorans TaxID=83263 RepID=UPI00285D928A|nr:DUF1127 domain-containing protein [Aminobacter aminovorans]MDR7224188.1 uncharacterized protein YjiS (DUF1127 family) [Aminobacter aminovorans]
MSTIDAIGGVATAASLHRKHGGLRGFVGWLAFCMERRRTRLALLELTDDQLADIGISRCDAYREGLRPFYD